MLRRYFRRCCRRVARRRSCGRVSSLATSGLLRSVLLLSSSLWPIRQWIPLLGLLFGGSTLERGGLWSLSFVLLMTSLLSLPLRCTTLGVRTQNVPSVFFSPRKLFRHTCTGVTAKDDLCVITSTATFAPFAKSLLLTGCKLCTTPSLAHVVVITLCCADRSSPCVKRLWLRSIPTTTFLDVNERGKV